MNPAPLTEKLLETATHLAEKALGLAQKGENVPAIEQHLNCIVMATNTIKRMQVQPLGLPKTEPEEEVLEKLEIDFNVETLKTKFLAHFKSLEEGLSAKGKGMLRKVLTEDLAEDLVGLAEGQVAEDNRETFAIQG